jgi:hypothetical protein
MDSMDNFRERLEALEQQTKAMKTHTRTIEQRLRWWRGLSCGVVMLSLLSLALPSGKAADAPARGMAERMATLENKLAAMAFDAASNEVVVTGANLRIVNGLGTTETTNGLGNLIVGYNELRSGGRNTRTGSHNVVVGEGNNFSSFGGLVVGAGNEISGHFASVSGGQTNTASGDFASISGGIENTADARAGSISGGMMNRIIGLEVLGFEASSISGGSNNIAKGAGVLHPTYSGPREPGYFHLRSAGARSPGRSARPRRGALCPGGAQPHRVQERLRHHASRGRWRARRPAGWWAAARPSSQRHRCVRTAESAAGDVPVALVCGRWRPDVICAADA